MPHDAPEQKRPTANITGDIENAINIEPMIQPILVYMIVRTRPNRVMKKDVQKLATNPPKQNVDTAIPLYWYTLYNTIFHVKDMTFSYHCNESMGKQSGKYRLLTWASPYLHDVVVSPGMLGDPIVQPLLKLPIHDATTQNTM